MCSEVTLVLVSAVELTDLLVEGVRMPEARSCFCFATLHISRLSKSGEIRGMAATAAWVNLEHLIIPQSPVRSAESAAGLTFQSSQFTAAQKDDFSFQQLMSGSGWAESESVCFGLTVSPALCLQRKLPGLRHLLWSFELRDNWAEESLRRGGFIR